MSALHRRQQSLISRQMASVKPIIEDADTMGEPLYVVDEDHETPQKELDLPVALLDRVPSRKESRNNLRIETYSSADLHDRYMSSEEEPSPSPDSDSESPEEELKHKTPAAAAEEHFEPTIAEESTAEIAVAVPILQLGRPKLVDITNLAPMHKRKRVEKPILSRSVARNAIAARASGVTDENSPVIAHETPQAIVSNDHASVHLPKRKDSLSVLAPDRSNTEITGDDTLSEGKEDDFPHLDLRNPPTYHDYDPYSLDPPRLSPKNSYTSSGKKPGSVTRARNSSSQSNASNNGWKGLARPISIVKKQNTHRGDQQLAKKPRMIPRPADEREEIPVIPPFPEDGALR